MKKQLTSLSTSAFLLLVSANQVFGQASGIDPGTGGDTSNSREVGFTDVPAWLKGITPDKLLGFIINAFFALAIIAALVYLLWGGLNWILSGGDKDKIDAARSRIIAAIIGLVLVILAYVILNFVLVLLGFGGLTSLTLPTLRAPGTVVEGQP